nr:MAG TPA: hypothetical protein [Caudoviricetes sp.]
MPLLKQKTLVSASAFFESGRYSITYLYYTIFYVRKNKKTASKRQRSSVIKF